MLRWVFDLVVCDSGGRVGARGRIQTVCWSEETANTVIEPIWSAAVGLWLVSAVLYTIYLVRALQARKYIVALKWNAREQDVMLSQLEYADLEERARERRESERERSRKIVDL
jgi:hypothetical protein